MNAIVGTARGSSQAIRNDRSSNSGVDDSTGELIIRARVDSVSQQAVVISGTFGRATANLATDEPLQAGQNCWAVRTTEGGYLVLGSAS